MFTTYTVYNASEISMDFYVFKNVSISYCLQIEYMKYCKNMLFKAKISQQYAIQRDKLK